MGVVRPPGPYPWTAVAGEPIWLVLDRWSGLFWKPEAKGYGSILEAGFFTEAGAQQHASNPERGDEAIPLDRYREGIGRLARALSPDPREASPATDHPRPAGW